MAIEKIIARLPFLSAEKRQQIRQRAEAWIASGDPAKVRQAQPVLAAIRDIELQRVSPMPADATPKEKTKRVRAAFLELPPTKTEQKVIAALLDHPRSNTTHLSQVCGWRGHEPWYLHFGKACRAREVYLWPAKYVKEWKGPFYSGILAKFDYDGSRFTMKPEAEIAFLELRPDWQF